MTVNTLPLAVLIVPLNVALPVLPSAISRTLAVNWLTLGAAVGVSLMAPTLFSMESSPETYRSLMALLIAALRRAKLPDGTLAVLPRAAAAAAELIALCAVSGTA